MKKITIKEVPHEPVGIIDLEELIAQAAFASQSWHDELPEVEKALKHALTLLEPHADAAMKHGDELKKALKKTIR